MRIAIIAPITYAIPVMKYGPWENMVNTLACGLYDKGYDVTVFASKDSKAKFSLIGTVDLCLSKLDSFKHQQELIHISESIKYIKQGNFDIVHNNINWSGQLFLESLEIPYVHTIHGYEAEAEFVHDHYRDANYVSISYTERESYPELKFVANVYNGVDFDFFKLDRNKQDYFFYSCKNL